jgi:hypothetical protein
MRDNQKPPSEIRNGYGMDGYSNGRTNIPYLKEGPVRKGGVNPPPSQVLTRPPAPAPMRPHAPSLPAVPSVDIKK